MSGFLGVGPGFLLMPTLILSGFNPKKTAGINAFAVAPPSFSALVPHLPKAQWNFNYVIVLVIFAGLFSYFGARVRSIYVPDKRIKQFFGLLIVVVTLYKIFTMIK